ncbi:MAG TPA: cobalamin-independent methionine synthase II family protein [Chloroflexota bacterium]|jgi:5-methyltetrahydropteroyltriglutamate--homocysteine methyltransferase
MSILTTHTGSLPRPPELAERMLEYSNGQVKDLPGLWDEVARATREVVRHQVELGIDIVSDGEYGKASYAGYVKERLTGFEGEPRNLLRNLRDQTEFPDWVRSTPPRVTYPSNNAPVQLRDTSGVERDIANMKAALVGIEPSGVFMSAASPGVVDTFMPSTYYPTEEAYLRAVGAAMRAEYRAIVEAGFSLQVDCPDLAMSRHSRFANLSLEQFRATAQMHIDVLNAAIAGLPRERVRLHMCWGNYEGPHNHDIPLVDIVDIALQANVGALSIEAANPRHAHEWKVFRDVALPPGMKLIPGVIDSCTNYIEHPDLVAERLLRFAEVVGPDNVIAGTDCGFGTSVGPRHVAPSIAWAKLGSLVEGARIASAALLATV